MMAELLHNIAALAWLALAVWAFIKMRRWNKLFSELYDELKKGILEVNDDTT